VEQLTGGIIKSAASVPTGTPIVGATCSRNDVGCRIEPRAREHRQGRVRVSRRGWCVEVVLHFIQKIAIGGRRCVSARKDAQ